MNNQQFFDKTLEHLRKQGKAAVGDDGCYYRTSTGTKCAVGCHIPDELYDPMMEGQHVNAILDKWPALDTLFSGVHPRLMRDCQEAHDVSLNRRGPSAWEASMLEIASEHGLKYTPPQP